MRRDVGERTLLRICPCVRLFPFQSFDNPPPIKSSQFSPGFELVTFFSFSILHRRTKIQAHRFQY